MICYFWKSFKLSIKVKIKQQDWESMNFKEIVQRAVNAKAKAGLKSSTMVQDLDICYLRGYRSSNSTALKVQTQKTITKDFHPEKPKVKKTRPTLSWAKASKPSKQARKKRKKKGIMKGGIKNKLWLAPPIQQRSSRRKRKRTNTKMSVKSRVSTVIRRVTMLVFAPNLQKN